MLNLIKNIFVFFFLLTFSLAYGQGFDMSSIDLSKIRKDQIVVKVKDAGISLSKSPRSLTPSRITSLPFSKSMKPIARKQSKESSCLDGIFIIQLKEGEDVISALKSFQEYDNVLYAEPIYLEQMLLLPDDPMAQVSGGDQYYLDKVKAYDAWDITTGRSDIIIGISDTGIDLEHEDIASKIFKNENEIINGVDDDENGFIDDINGYDFGDENNNPQSTNSYHGNRVAGIAGAATNNGIGIAGVAYDCSISGLKVFPDGETQAFAAYEGIVYAADNDYDVINLSWGSTNTFGQFRQDVIDYAVLEKDLVIVAAGGNSGLDEDFFPASYNHILSVGWTNANDEKAASSTYSYFIDLMAPGVSITSTNSNNSYSSSSGSSFAAPIVAGAAALARDVYPDYSAQQIMEVIRVTTDNIYDVGSNSNYEGKLGSGRLNIYKALTADSLRAVRAASINHKGQFDDHAFFDDSLSIEFVLTNYLDPIEQGEITLSSPSQYVTIRTTPIPMAFSESFETETIDIVRSIYIHSDTPPETEIPIRLNFSEGSYQDFQHFTFTTSPDHVEIDNGNLALTIAGNGNLGYASDNFIDGNGLTLSGNRIAKAISLIIGNSADSVSDNATDHLEGLSRDNDFFTEEYIKFYNSDLADFYTLSTFTDTSSTTGLGLLVEQKAYGFSAEGLHDFLILEYRITNLENDTIRNVSVGMLSDWDLNNSNENRALFDLTTGITYASANDTLFTGMKWYKVQNPIHQSIDLSTNNGNSADISATLSDSVKYSLIAENLFDSAGFAGTTGNDIAQSIAISSIKFDPYGSKKAAIIIATGNSLADLQSNISAAELEYERILNSPPITETLVSCNGASLEIDPQSGTNFRFFRDAEGTQQIGEGESIQAQSITSDTSFYVQNIDSLYATAIGSIQVNLVEKVAQFQINDDTLYLDNPTVNTASFMDNSFDPISWHWDFGNGASATLQNPSINFRESGIYDITLSVETIQGCLDTETKKLVVTSRPGLPEIDDINVCSGDLTTLSESNSDSIHIYTSPETSELIFKGKDFEFTTVKDTIFYISKIENGFESLRKKIQVSVQVPEPSFHAEPNTTDQSTSFRLISDSDKVQTLEWIVDGELLSNVDSLSIEVTKNSYEVKLIATSTAGCKDSLTQTLTLSESVVPTLNFIPPCLGEALTLIPQNGYFFGFYHDEELTQFISKGEALTIENIDRDTTIFVVGLDSILPSAPLAVIINPIRFEFDIIPSLEILDLSTEKNVSFSTNSDSQVSWNWFIEGDQVSNLETIEIFLSTPGFYEIVCQGAGNDNCSFSDTIQYEVVSEIIEPLSKAKQSTITVFPNPTDSQFQIEGIDQLSTVTISNISGKEVMSFKTSTYNTFVDLGQFPPGLYLIKILSKNKTLVKHLILN
ncbi:MAG: S8 family serine peptidase [Cyclobacteriaceae bacterium]